MFANFLIGLREGLEAALVVGIVVAYLGKVGRRDLLGRAWLGIAAAAAISIAAGAALTFGPRGLSFEAQEAIGGTLSLIAVCFVTWMILWMARTSRTLRTDIEGRLAVVARAGGWGIVAIAALAVGREGLETALFLWAAARATGSSVDPFLGGMLGIAVAIVIGVLIYRGSVRLDLGRFFRWTGAALIVVAAGVLAYAIHDLQEAAILPGLNNLAFDVTRWVPPDSWYGTLLKGTVNFSPQTTVLQAVAWTLYVIVVVIAYRRTLRATHTKRPTNATPTKLPSVTTVST